MPIKIELFGSALKISLIKFKVSLMPPLTGVLRYPPLYTPFFDVFRGRSILSIKFLENFGKKVSFLKIKFSRIFLKISCYLLKKIKYLAFV